MSELRQWLEQNGWFQMEFYGNSAVVWAAAGIVAGLVFFLAIIIRGVVQVRALHRATRTDELWAHAIYDVAFHTRFWFMLLISLYLGSLALALPPETQHIVESIAIIALVIQGALWAGTLLRRWAGEYQEKHLTRDASSVTMISAATLLGRIAVWILALILILDNIGLQVTTLIAGLGIGGIAVALAAQNVLSDLFASISIVLDKPFVLGDFITVDDYMGTVEWIGLRTTHIRSLSGEQLVFSNTDLLKSRIRNFKRMHQRRITFQIGVVYGTPASQLAAIPHMIRDAVASQPNTRFDRAHFQSFADSALIFEVVYYVLDPDYNLYMDIQQAINLRLVEVFEAERIEFAYPTHTIFLHQQQLAEG